MEKNMKAEREGEMRRQDRMLFLSPLKRKCNHTDYKVLVLGLCLNELQD